jgi:hypothetical protein
MVRIFKRQYLENLIENIFYKSEWNHYDLNKWIKNGCNEEKALKMY